MKSMSLLGAALLLGACQQQHLVADPTAPSQVRGHVLATASCAACHGIERDSVQSPNPQAPSFPTIVNRQALTSESLSSWLRDAHNYPAEMKFELDSRNVDDLVAYMLTLRDPEYRPIG